VFGPEHTSIATYLTEYAAMLRKNRRKVEATRLDERAQEIRGSAARNAPGVLTVDVRDLEAGR
jgi:hypothetical protein